MNGWVKLLTELARRLTAPLAFAVMVIIVLALLGERISPPFVPLVYALSLGVPALWAVVETIRVIIRARKSHAIAHQPGGDEIQGPKEQPPLTESRRAYLNAIMTDCRQMRLVGIDPQAADPLRGGLTLEALYISLDTTTQLRIKPAGKPKGKIESEESRPLSAVEALATAEGGRMVLLGLPGSGKSTFVRYLALRMAQAEVDRSLSLQELLPGWEGGSVLPLMISLGQLAETIPTTCKIGHAGLIEDYILQTLRADERKAPFANFILDELARLGGLVLFDGLDEVANLALRPLVVQAIEDFVQKYGPQPSSRFLVTCRTYSYHHDPNWQLTGWTTHELAALDEEKIRDFVNAWHNEHIRIEPSRKADFERKRERMLLALQPDDRRRLYEIAPIPLILTMMAVVHTHYGELPDTRAEVYERCVELLLVRWELERTVLGHPRQTFKRTILDELGISRVVLDRALWEVAYRAHEGDFSRQDKEHAPALITEDLLSGVLQAHFQDLDKVRVFLEYCQSSNGLLMLQGSVVLADAPPGTPPRRVYAFPHPTFEEYLAARYLIRPGFGKEVRRLAQTSERWREVILFLGETLCFQQKDQERMEALLNALTPQQPPQTSNDPDWRLIWYAGDLLTLYRRAFPSEPASCEQRLRTQLHSLIIRPALSPRERASAADTLDELDYVPEDLYAFIPVPDPQWPLFLIAKYPTTNLQYARFLQPENFANRALWVDFPKFDQNSQPMSGQTWGEEGWLWLQRQLVDKRNPVKDGVLYPRFWHDRRFGFSRKTAPVIGISWYEANAYCKWLVSQPNLPEWQALAQSALNPSTLTPRLPTEEEWVLAAGGDDNDRFAWGRPSTKEEISNYANTRESGIGRTTPVWMYPRGASPLGVMDLSGNAWEWQANYYDKDHEVLALRGGSWNNNWNNARVANRNNNHPNNPWNNNGFRVVALHNSTCQQFVRF